MSLPRYPKYKSSGVPWLGLLPAHWDVHKTKRHFLRKKHVNAGMECENRLALTMNGVVPRSLDDLEGLQSSDYEGYQIFEAGDLAFKLIDLQNIKTSRVGLVPERGIMSPAYIRLEPRNTISNRFAYWYFMALYWTQVFNSLGGGVRQTLGPEELLTVDLPLPPLDEQLAIAGFLDRETAKIDALIAEQEKLLTLLAEKRQATISHSVTRGLDSSAPVRASSIRWLDEVPAHWSVVRLTTLFQEIVEDGDDELPILSVSIHDGVSDRELDEAEMDRKVTRSDDRSKYKRVAPNDLAYNMMRAWQGAFGAVQVAGQVSPAYVVARPRMALESRFVELVLRTPGAIEEVRRFSRGITEFRLRLYWDEFKNMRIALPPLDEQCAILTALAAMERQFKELSAAARQVISMLQERRSALITAAVTGQIDVRGLAPC